jgi:hypothetical protein
MVATLPAIYYAKNVHHEDWTFSLFHAANGGFLEFHFAELGFG